MKEPLVDFDHTPSPAPLWAEAGHDAAAFGAALDRVFGEAGDVHVVEHFASGADPIVIIDDPLVLLGNLMDGLGLPAADSVPHAPMPELAAVYDFAPDGLHLSDLWVHDPHA
jgi:hypothetical protein